LKFFKNRSKLDKDTATAMGIQVHITLLYIHSIAKALFIHAQSYFYSPSLILNCRLQGLTKLLADHAPEAMREQKFENYFGRKIAVDASMHIYAFLVRFSIIIELELIDGL
jgi:hypothetical protein